MIVRLRPYSRFSSLFSHPIVGEAVEVVADTRRATEGPANVLWSTLRRPTAPNAVDAARSDAAVERM